MKLNDKVELSDLLEKVDLLELASQHTTLNKDGNRYFGICPLHKEDTPSFCIEPEKKLFYCFGCGAGGTAIDYIIKKNNVNIAKSIEILCDYAGCDIKKPSNLAENIRIFKKFGKNDVCSDSFSPIILSPDIMKKYTKKPIKEWLNEGISQEALDKYQVCYDFENNRIVFPIFDHKGNIIAISGRTLYEDYKNRKDRKGKSIPKYIYYGYIGTTHFLYAYFQNKGEIIKKNEILVFEGAKSVFKCEGFGYYNAVASMTNKFSSKQIEELIKIPIRDIVLCWDNDIENSIPKLKKKLGILLNFKNVYVAKDYGGFLNAKDSPVDQGKDTWEKIYKNKKRIF